MCAGPILPRPLPEATPRCFPISRTAITRGAAAEGLDGVQTVSGATALDHDPLDFVERERELVVRAVVELVRGDLLCVRRILCTLRPDPIPQHLSCVEVRDG